MELDLAREIIIKEFGSTHQSQRLLEIQHYAKLLNPNLFVTFWEEYENERKCIEAIIFLLDNKSIRKKPMLGYTLYSNSLRNFLFANISLASQLESFRLYNGYMFYYDFNHDGLPELLYFEESGTGNSIGIGHYDVLGLKMKVLFDEGLYFDWSHIKLEFINYKGKQGIRFYSIDKWIFYYYDRIQQKYVQDKSASPEELEQIHGNPDFFAEAGIDYLKLERPLVPADLEGFSKPALRIWRNAVYARRGRTFKSEDLQALFNEYAWYKADKDYSDAKLSGIDRVNIKLIQEFERK